LFSSEEREGWGEMGERRGGGRECGGKEEDMEQREMGMHEK